ncbi:MAG: DegV family protein, partial [Enterococcus sp.]|uniref:DegV family protein n=1 Tax=Enterococcus sp. TaxID=35783 RepID=UPI002FC600E4
MKLAIVTDSTAYLNERTRNHKDLFVIPIPVIIDGEPFEEGVDIGYEEFYHKLKDSKNFPKTSQPVLGEVYELYRSIKEHGAAIIGGLLKIKPILTF